MAGSAALLVLAAPAASQPTRADEPGVGVVTAGDHEDDGPGPGSTHAPETPSFRDRLGYGVAIGYGAGIAPRSRQKGRDVADVESLTLQPQLFVALTRVREGAPWYHGALDAVLEGLFIVDVEPRTGYGGGIDAGLRYRLRAGRRVEPWVAATIGLGGIDLDLASQADGFAFFLAADFGARMRLDDRFWLTTSFRWQHVSNAQITQPNNGIDTIGFRIGLELR